MAQAIDSLVQTVTSARKVAIKEILVYINGPSGTLQTYWDVFQRKNSAMIISLISLLKMLMQNWLK